MNDVSVSFSFLSSKFQQQTELDYLLLVKTNFAESAERVGYKMIIQPRCSLSV